jgi:L-ascorbate metabolism protein UlaG (beta-lactamase superfamily)
MHITYLGQCGFLIEIGGARIVTDPYLSDYADRHDDNPGAAWVRNYAPPCALLDLNPDAVLISHAHNDHMDPWTLGPYRAAGGDCAVAAPAPECGRLYDMGFSNIIEARAEHAFMIRKTKITPIMCAHTEPHADEEGRFHELSYFIEADGVKLFFGGDLSLYDGLVERLVRETPDYALLPANGRDEQRTAKGIIGNTDAREAAAVAAACGAALIPTHYDLYDINGCPIETIRDAARYAGARLINLCPGVRVELYGRM